MSWFPRRPVVVPVDFSEASFKAIDVAWELVSAPADLYVVHVVPVDDLGDLWTPRREEALSRLGAKLDQCRFHGVQIDVLYGDPGSEVAKFAAEKNSELIVMSSHGRTGLAHILLGSVAERVLRLAHCPVLIVR